MDVIHPIDPNPNTNLHFVRTLGFDMILVPKLKKYHPIGTMKI